MTEDPGHTSFSFKAQNIGHTTVLVQSYATWCKTAATTGVSFFFPLEREVCSKCMFSFKFSFSPRCLMCRTASDDICHAFPSCIHSISVMGEYAHVLSYSFSSTAYFQLLNLKLLEHVIYWGKVEWGEVARWRRDLFHFAYSTFLFSCCTWASSSASQERRKRERNPKKGKSINGSRPLLHNSIITRKILQ